NQPQFKPKVFQIPHRRNILMSRGEPLSCCQSIDARRSRRARAPELTTPENTARGASFRASGDSPSACPLQRSKIPARRAGAPPFGLRAPPGGLKRWSSFGPEVAPPSAERANPVSLFLRQIVALALFAARRPEPWAFALAAAALVPLTSVHPSWGDALEFTASAPILGVPHPTGYPLYALASKVAAEAPVSSLARRMNLLSAASMALAAALMASCLFALVARDE